MGRILRRVNRWFASSRAVGLVVIALGVFVLAQSVYFNLEERANDEKDEAQDERDRAQALCLEQKFAELSTVLEKRGELTAQETDLNQRETILNERASALSARNWLVYVDAAVQLADNPTGELSATEQEKLQVELVETLVAYGPAIRKINAERAEIKKARDLIKVERQENPLPPYPVGVCKTARAQEAQDAKEQAQSTETPTVIRRK